MGDPKKQKKKYETPTHPWQKEVIDSEREILKEYGLASKKELWVMKSHLRKFKALTKRYSNPITDQAKKEKELFLAKLRRLGMLKSEQGLDDVLGLSLKDILERRLQTQVFRRNMANSIRQARQFIVHNHIMLSDEKVNVPSYLVKKEEEGSLSFAYDSPMKNPEHPEIQAALKKAAK